MKLNKYGWIIAGILGFIIGVLTYNPKEQSSSTDNNLLKKEIVADLLIVEKDQKSWKYKETPFFNGENGEEINFHKEQK